jgi:hypothetical protein
LLTGFAAVGQDGVSKSTMVIGQSVARTGQAATLGARQLAIFYTATARAYAEAPRGITRQLTQAKLRQSIEGRQEVDVGGIRVHFVRDRVGSERLDLSVIESKGRIREYAKVVIAAPVSQTLQSGRLEP